jgi:hypothetical protein
LPPRPCASCSSRARACERSSTQGGQASIFERALLTVFSKTGRRHIYLPPPAIAILTALPRHGEYVIPGQVDGKPRADLNRPWRMVSRRASLEGVRLHDVRHSFASVAVSGGATLPVVGRLLGHTQPQTTMRYAHLTDDPLREVANRTAQIYSVCFPRRLSDLPVEIRRVEFAAVFFSPCTGPCFSAFPDGHFSATSIFAG